MRVIAPAVQLSVCHVRTREPEPGSDVSDVAERQVFYVCIVKLRLSFSPKCLKVLVAPFAPGPPVSADAARMAFPFDHRV